MLSNDELLNTGEMERNQNINSNILNSKKFVGYLTKFYDSPFMEDRKFIIGYLAKLTRDNIHDCEEALNSLFYDRIFKMIAPDTAAEWKLIDEMNQKNAFEILCNMIPLESQRIKLLNMDKIRDVFE